MQHARYWQVGSTFHQHARYWQVGSTFHQRLLTILCLREVTYPVMRNKNCENGVLNMVMAFVMVCWFQMEVPLAMGLCHIWWLLMKKTDQPYVVSTLRDPNA